jgi:hypothetical protein
MLFPVAPFDQFRIPEQPVAVTVAFSSPHTVNLSALTAGASGFSEVPMVTAMDAPDVPQLVEHVAVYVPGPTWIDDPVAPLDQFTVPAHPLAVSVAFSSPHTFSLSAVTAGAAGLFVVPMVTDWDAADVPQAVVHVTLYVPLPT